MRTASARTLATLSLMLGAIATPACATPACWDPPTINAARMHEFNVIGMTLTLRCNMIGMDFQTNLERLSAIHRARFEAADKVLRKHFNVEGTRGENWTDYQRYLTYVANLYGGGATTRRTCDVYGALLADLVQSVTPDQALDGAMLAMVRDPHLNGPVCGQTPA